MNSSEIRQRFEEYYKELGFSPLPRAPLLHPSIPMSFVMSAGLVQIETSLATAAHKPGDKFILVQECFRHFDLDKVGADDIHLTLFEMPAAFVFGPNGKAETIQRVWTLMTSILGIDESKIWVSYFEGGQVLGENLAGDEETRCAWLEAGVPESRVVGLGADDNYWVQGGGIDGMGTTRKCGPHAEMFYDRGIERACGLDCRPGCKCGRFVEFSNSLFVCHELDSKGRVLSPLAQPFTESVIGTERVAMILQDAQSVFEIDIYQPVIDAIHSFVRKSGLPKRLVVESERVIADYLRALYFLVTDGAPPPGKDGRERIIKLLIRGIITRQIVLGIESRAFLSTLMDRISRTANGALLAIPEDRERLESYFSTEARHYLKTVEHGRHQLARLLKENDGRTLSGPQVVWLEKKCGLPHLLTAAVLHEKRLGFAEAEYKEAFEAWKQTSHD